MRSRRDNRLEGLDCTEHELRPMLVVDRGLPNEALLQLIVFEHVLSSDDSWCPPLAMSSTDLEAAKPLLRAYALGYLTSVAPRLLGLLRTVRRTNRTWAAQLDQLRNILITSTQLNRFPTAAALIIGGATTLPALLVALVERFLTALLRRDRPRLGQRLIFCIKASCSFLSAWLAFELLNRDEGWARKRAQSRSAAIVRQQEEPLPLDVNQPTQTPRHVRYAGKTIDFTLFAFCRALDVLIITAWTRSRAKPSHPEQRTPRLASLLRRTVDPAVFATSAAIIMWSWFYSPERLPRSYNHWISRVANIDSRLIQALRLARQGVFVYGQDNGQASLLAGLCHELGLPEEYGNPAKTIPIPCELYHCGAGKSCEVHALKRLWKSWEFAMGIYLPLQLITLIRARRSRSVRQSLQAAAGSSSFLAVFVASFYYAVCLARTRLGPRILSPKTVTPQMWDSGLCVLAGCLACGWSILLETPSRRQEIAFFVAPRALATILPRVYDKRHQKREQVAFASSVAVVLTALSSSHGQNVRGVLGRILGGIVS
jgi:hypothetical protein